LGAVIHALLRTLRARDREAQRREAELLNRLMFLAGRPWAEPPRPEERTFELPPDDEVVWPDAITLETE